MKVIDLINVFSNNKKLRWVQISFGEDDDSPLYCERGKGWNYQFSREIYSAKVKDWSIEKDDEGKLGIYVII